MILLPSHPERCVMWSSVKAILAVIKACGGVRKMSTTLKYGVVLKSELSL